MNDHVKLGVNIDHVATLRNARGGFHPDPVRAAEVAISAGADLITVHLREDRRHIIDEDVRRVRALVAAPLNLEVGATAAMAELAVSFQPDTVCFVPERRQERTTEGGLDARANAAFLRDATDALHRAGIAVTLFLEPDPLQMIAAGEIGADAVEIHTGRYCDSLGDAQVRELRRIEEAARQTARLGIECHAGHGLNFDNVGDVAAVKEVVELNIGHFLVGEAVFSGLAEVIAEMRQRIDLGRRSGRRAG
ncbi:MAG: pyridoxine 5'-phosphate synthase [Rhodospirillales bacterium]|nr:pyridoxine 5'-phosphate synthase [Rhodospirillales bacterium]